MTDKKNLSFFEKNKLSPSRFLAGKSWKQDPDGNLSREVIKRQKPSWDMKIQRAKKEVVRVPCKEDRENNDN